MAAMLDMPFIMLLPPDQKRCQINNEMIETLEIQLNLFDFISVPNHSMMVIDYASPSPTKK